jgi:putative restriction endonuclease
MHDRAFDCGLLTITQGLKVKISPKAKGVAADRAIGEFLWRFEGVSISPPRRFAPDADFLRYHNERVFLNR